MKVTYLDQLHWIELSSAVHGRARFPDTAHVLETLRQARASGRACFPISYAHYIETRKHRDAERRHRLATLMWELSGGITVAPPPVVIRHEIEVALEHCFPGRVVPELFQMLGRGATHANPYLNFDIPMNWLPGVDAMPASLRAAVETFLRATAEPLFLSGVSQMGEPLEWGPLTSRTEERQYGTSLEQWRGARARYSREDELERDIYATNLSQIDSQLQEALARHNISRDEFAQLSESQRWAFLNAMPWQRAEMHLKRELAKNADLKPNKRHSDLIDWAFLSVAVSYCDIVVTERHMANLFSRARGFDTPTHVIHDLSLLPELVA